jgi:hypothetical protein
LPLSPAALLDVIAKADPETPEPAVPRRNSLLTLAM